MVVMLVGLAVAIGIVVLCVGGALALARRRQRARFQAARMRERSERRRRALERQHLAAAASASFTAREGSLQRLHRGLSTRAVERIAPACIYMIAPEGRVHFVPAKKGAPAPEDAQGEEEHPASSVDVDVSEAEEGPIEVVLQVEDPGDDESLGSEGSVVSLEDREESCCICLNEFQCGDLVRVLPCDQRRKHIFCLECIDQWLSTKAECPICKRTFTRRTIRRGRPFRSIEN